MKDFMQIEQINEASTPDEMRQEIRRLRQFDHMTKSVMDAADYSGASGEDRYVLLAYHALREKQRLMKIIMGYEFIRPIPPLSWRKDDGKDPQSESAA